jgi:hypothetical protein
MELAHAQQARLIVLRSATDLGRLWQNQDNAGIRISSLLWFTAGSLKALTPRICRMQSLCSELEQPERSGR